MSKVLAALLGSSRRLTAATWARGKVHWYAGCLTVACGMFIAGAWGAYSQERQATNDIMSKLGVAAANGGGVLMVMGADECIATLDAVGDVARQLIDAGVFVRGLVVQEGAVPAVLEVVLRAANDRFPHEAVSWASVRPLVGVIGTPALIGVSSDGGVRFIEHMSTLVRGNPGGAPQAAEDLVARVGDL